MCAITFSTHLLVVSVCISSHHDSAHVGDLHLRYFVLSLSLSTSNLLLLLLLRLLAVPLSLVLGYTFLSCITGITGRTVVWRTCSRCLCGVCIFVEIRRFLVVNVFFWLRRLNRYEKEQHVKICDPNITCCFSSLFGLQSP